MMAVKKHFILMHKYHKKNGTACVCNQGGTAEVKICIWTI